jgi:hypothetical protein
MLVGKTAPRSANETATSDYSRVRMKIMTHSDTMAVTLQKTCKPCWIGQAVSLPYPTTEEKMVRMGWLLRS